MTGRTLTLVGVGLLVAVGLAVFVAPWADPSPDGLEKVAETQGFSETARDHDLEEGPLADYGVRAIGEGRLSTALAGLVGTLLTFGVGLAVFGLLRRRRAERDPAGHPS